MAAKRLETMLTKRYLNLCQAQYHRSYALGYGYYHHLVRSCADIWVQSAALNQAFIGVDIPLEHGDEDFMECKVIGWQLGFLRGHDELWQPCSSQLDEALQEALQKHLEKCVVAGKDVGTDLKKLLVSSPQLHEFRQEERNFVELVLFALIKHYRYQDAWDFIVSEHREAYENLPCTKIFLDNLP